MEWTQQEGEVWTLSGARGAGAGQALGTVRYRDGSWWGELQPATGGSGSLEEPGRLSEEQFEESMANLPEPLGPFDGPDQAKSAVEGAVR
jgi:hypothetical protein